METLDSLNIKYAILLEKIRNHLPPGIQFTISPVTGIQIVTTYFDEGRPIEEILNTPLAVKVAYEIKDFDWPTSKSEGLKFSQFMGFSEDDTKAILDACHPDEVVEEFIHESIDRDFI